MLSHSQPGILASAATGFAPWVENHGGDIDRIFGNAGIPPELAGSPTLQFSLAAFCALLDQGARLTGNDNLGLWFGNQFEPRDMGLIGFAAVSAPTLGTALSTFAELYPLHQQASFVRLTSEPRGLLKLEYRIESAHVGDKRQDAEHSLGSFLNIFRECKGRGWAPEEVHFEHPQPADRREHSRAFSAPVYFSQQTNALLFKPEIMACPMPSRDPRLFTAMRQCMQRLGEHNDYSRSATIADRLKSAIRAHLPDGLPSLELLAQELDISVGAINRDLRQQGTGYKELIDATRRELALQYLRQRQLSLTEISFLLGYSELSALSRAVQRWTGQSPRALRGRIDD